jgi:hypothetical protein
VGLRTGINGKEIILTHTGNQTPTPSTLKKAASSSETQVPKHMASRLIKVKVKVKLSRNRPWRPIGLRDVEDPTLSRQSAHS